ncbi:MAG: hypothetical protein MN733_35145 [Nitrososphaera sp.]|nr:hypothetical protein [Nitrososphaera sp.]
MPIKEWRVQQLLESQSIHGYSWIPVSKYGTLEDAISWCQSWAEDFEDYGVGKDWHFRIFNEVTKEIIPWEAL